MEPLHVKPGHAPAHPPPLPHHPPIPAPTPPPRHTPVPAPIAEPPPAPAMPEAPAAVEQTTEDIRQVSNPFLSSAPSFPTPASHLPSETGKRLYPAVADPKPGAVVIHCSDPRFQPAFEEFLEHELGLAKGSYIPIVVGGGAGVLGHPEQLPKEFKFIKERLEAYRQVFPTARQIILINHENCHYYESLKSRAMAMIGSRLHMPLDLGRNDLSLVAESFRHFLSHLGYSIEFYYAKFADPDHKHIEIEKVAA